MTPRDGTEYVEFAETGTKTRFFGTVDTLAEGNANNENPSEEHQAFVESTKQAVTSTLEQEAPEY